MIKLKEIKLERCTRRMNGNDNALWNRRHLQIAKGGEREKTLEVMVIQYN